MPKTQFQVVRDCKPIIFEEVCKFTGYRKLGSRGSGGFSQQTLYILKEEVGTVEGNYSHDDPGISYFIGWIFCTDENYAKNHADKLNWKTLRIDPYQRLPRRHGMQKIEKSNQKHRVGRMPTLTMKKTRDDIVFPSYQQWTIEDKTEVAREGVEPASRITFNVFELGRVSPAYGDPTVTEIQCLLEEQLGIEKDPSEQYRTHTLQALSDLLQWNYTSNIIRFNDPYELQDSEMLGDTEDNRTQLSRIVFFGPGKSQDLLVLAVDQREYKNLMSSVDSDLRNVFHGPRSWENLSKYLDRNEYPHMIPLSSLRSHKEILEMQEKYEWMVASKVLMSQTEKMSDQLHENVYLDISINNITIDTRRSVFHLDIWVQLVMEVRPSDIYLDATEQKTDNFYEDIETIAKNRATSMSKHEDLRMEFKDDEFDVDQAAKIGAEAARLSKRPSRKISPKREETMSGTMQQLAKKFIDKQTILQYLFDFYYRKKAFEYLQKIKARKIKVPLNKKLYKKLEAKAAQIEFINQVKMERMDTGTQRDVILVLEVEDFKDAENKDWVDKKMPGDCKLYLQSVKRYLGEMRDLEAAVWNFPFDTQNIEVQMQALGHPIQGTEVHEPGTIVPCRIKDIQNCVEPISHMLSSGQVNYESEVSMEHDSWTYRATSTRILDRFYEFLGESHMVLEVNVRAQRRAKHYVLKYQAILSILALISVGLLWVIPEEDCFSLISGNLDILITMTAFQLTVNTILPTVRYQTFMDFFVALCYVVPVFNIMTVALFTGPRYADERCMPRSVIVTNSLWAVLSILLFVLWSWYAFFHPESDGPKHLFYVTAAMFIAAIVYVALELKAVA
eukprot:m.137654 g.137654  ORF g.137654 m.137654 type:complete len:842 (-) comp14757_c1_seq3:1148-3673(-)